MTRFRAAIETIHLTLLGLWGGAIAATGLAAAVAFPIMKRLDPSLTEFAAYPHDHWRIAAGQVMNPVFHIVGMFGLVAGSVAWVTLVLVFRCGALPSRRVSTWLRLGGTVGAFACVILSVWIVQRQMDVHLAGFLDAARAGDADVADTHREAFDGLHPIASNLMKANLLLVLIAFVAGLWSVTRATPAPRAEGDE